MSTWSWWRPTNTHIAGIPEYVILRNTNIASIQIHPNNVACIITHDNCKHWVAVSPAEIKIILPDMP